MKTKRTFRTTQNTEKENQAMSDYERYLSDLCSCIAIRETIERLMSILSEERRKYDAFFEEKRLPKWMSGVAVSGLKHILDGALEKHLTREKVEGVPMTMPQAQYIQVICETLGVDFPGIMTKQDATEWLKVHVPRYKERIAEEEIEWEANNSEICDSYGDYQ